MGVTKLTDKVKEQILGFIRSGLHPSVACTAVGLGPRYLTCLRQVSRDGSDESARVFLAAIETAIGLAEAEDVITTKRAAKVDPIELVCPHCSEPFKGDPVHLANVVGAAESAQRMKLGAAGMAMTRLERRFAQRWSQRVTHTVQEEHERLLDVCERILTPEVFELLCQEYFAEIGDAAEAPQSPREPSSPDIH